MFVAPQNFWVFARVNLLERMSCEGILFAFYHVKISCGVDESYLLKIRSYIKLKKKVYCTIVHINNCKLYLHNDWLYLSKSLIEIYHIITFYIRILIKITKFEIYLLKLLFFYLKYYCQFNTNFESLLLNNFRKN